MPTKKTKQDILEQLEQRNTIHPSVTPADPNFVYGNIHQYIEWNCTQNHIWKAPIIRILQGKGCPICSRKQVGDNNITNITQIKTKLRERNIQYPNQQVVLNELTFKGTSKKCEWTCMSGHKWEAEPKTVLRGSYCPECRRLNNIKRQTDTHETILEKLYLRNKRSPNNKVYLHPSVVVASRNVDLMLMCDSGHTWNGKINDVINQDTGCPICAKSGFSYKAIDWLNHISLHQNINIRHVKNGGEFRIPKTKYHVDGYCKENNTVYEFYGDMWHGNPNKFKPTELNIISKISYGELFQKTLIREQNIKKQGYNLVTIWESEWDEQQIKLLEKQFCNSIKVEIPSVEINKQISPELIPLTVFIPESNIGIKFWEFDKCREQVTQNRKIMQEMKKAYAEHGITLIQIFEDEWTQNQQLVLSKVKHYAHQNTTQPIHARKCVIKHISTNEKNQFLNSFHIQGADNSQIRLGAFYKNELVAVMTFSTPRVAVGNQKNTSIGTYELVRFATHSGYRVVGIASKMLKHFEKTHEWSSIYSFADGRWSVGNMYQQLGFELNVINNPDYFYIIDGERKHRWNYRKDVLKNTLPNYTPTKTEYENMLEAGYDRVWGVGTLRYVKYNR